MEQQQKIPSFRQVPQFSCNILFTILSRRWKEVISHKSWKNNRREVFTGKVTIFTLGQISPCQNSFPGSLFFSSLNHSITEAHCTILLGPLPCKAFHRQVMDKGETSFNITQKNNETGFFYKFYIATVLFSYFELFRGGPNKMASAILLQSISLFQAKDARSSLAFALHMCTMCSLFFFLSVFLCPLAVD